MKRSPMKRTPFTSEPQKRMKRVTAKRVAKRASLEGLAGLHHMGWIKMQACVSCGAAGPSDAHHSACMRYSSMRRSDFLALPLCRSCHITGPNAYHKSKASFRSVHGPDYLLALKYLIRSPYLADANIVELLDGLPEDARTLPEIIALNLPE